MKMSVVILFCLLAVTCNAQVKSPGRCPEIPAMQNFDLKRFEGVWYDQRHYKTNLRNDNCTNNKYTVNSTNHASVLISMMIRSNETTLLPVQQSGEMQRKDNATDGSFILTLKGVTAPNNVFIPSFKGNYTILAVNYTSLALVWSCTTNPTNEITNNQSVWFLSRQPKLSAADILTMNGVLNTFPHISTNLLVTADRNMCKNTTTNQTTGKNSSNQNTVNFVIVFLFSAVLFFSR